MRQVATGGSVIGGYEKWYVVTEQGSAWKQIGCSADYYGCRCTATIVEACCSAWKRGEWLGCSGGYVSVGSYNGSEPYATIRRPIRPAAPTTTSFKPI
ncbi:MAG: hypothetical protein JW955_05985 [Sedimentisphaerales bacterium]|nr:hypothetical protein [Sedimentisphaerales bacterium]